MCIIASLVLSSLGILPTTLHCTHFSTHFTQSNLFLICS